MELKTFKAILRRLDEKATILAKKLQAISPRAWFLIAACAIALVKAAEGQSTARIAGAQITIILLSTLAGYGLGWFLSPSAASLRKVIAAILGLLAMILFLGEGNGASWSMTWLTALVGFFLALGAWLGTTARGFFAKPTTFGSAEWATLPYLEEHGLIGETGLRLGYFAGPDGLQPVHYTGDRHMLTIAPTRAGKGSSSIIPNLLTYDGSVLIIDPKGENALITADQRDRMGQELHIVDPWNIAANGCASRFNPLDWLDPNDPDITENAMLLADALVVGKGNKSDPFWTEEAKALLHGKILYVATDPREADQRHLARVRDLLLLDGEDMTNLWQRMMDSPHHIVASTGVRCAQKDEKLMSNVIASAQAETHFLDSARIRESLSRSDFKFEDLKTRPMSIYLVLPADRLDTFGRWLRLLIQQAITVNARNIEQKPEKPILFMLDELPSLSRLSAVEQAFGLMAGYGMTMWGVAQDLSQLVKIYGEHGYQTLIANSGIVYMGSRDKMTAEYFSSLCGMQTVWNISTAISRAVSTSSGAKGGSSSHSTTDSSTAALTQRPLAFADELMRLPSHKQLVLIENHHPIAGIKQPWFENDALKDLGRNLHAS
ncbi:MAG: type IV secretory system conjugative DNA transfer family protein [Novosphingobium sp.]|nr:type IV secretory system conjugative DNA transfer family protein [Novosphingobium sp.]